MQTPDNTLMCCRRGNRKTQRKTSLPPFKRQSIYQTISWDTWVSKRPFKPNLPTIPKPSKLLLQQGFLEPCLVQLSESRNPPDYIRQASPASFGNSPKLPKLQNTLYTLKMCGLCLGTNLVSRYDKDFSLRMSSSLSKRQVCVCVVENLSRVFLSEWPPYNFCG